MDINNKKPEDVLKPEFIQQYKELHNDIWHRLIHVHTNIIILEKIEKFPFEHFHAPQENIFWTMVYWNFLYMSIAFIHSLTTDEGDQKHTLRLFASRLFKDWINDSEKERYHEKLRTAKLDKNLQGIRSKITAMRHNIIAHRFLNNKSGWKVKDVEGLTVSEIRKVYNDTEKLFHACSFGPEYATKFYLDGTCGGKPIEKDIDKLLDLIAKNSYWLNKPERKKDFWPAIRQTISEEDITELNEFRKRFGLPEV